jgi:sulfonate transport system permease protein
MAYTAHQFFRVYKRHHHLVLAFIVLLLPIAGIIIIGKISHLSFDILLTALGLSIIRLVIAYALSLGVALSLAMFLAEHPLGDFLIPVLDILQNLPSFALIPLFVAWFGITDKMTIIFAATSIVWPIFFYVLSSFKTARIDLNEAATIFGATGWKRIRYYLLPLCFPALVTGSIVALSIGWEAIIGIEIIGALQGIGSFLNENSDPASRTTLILGISSLLFIVFTINKLIWVPLMRHAQLYAE